MTSELPECQTLFFFGSWSSVNRVRGSSRTREGIGQSRTRIGFVYLHQVLLAHAAVLTLGRKRASLIVLYYFYLRELVYNYNDLAFPWTLWYLCIVILTQHNSLDSDILTIWNINAMDANSAFCICCRRSLSRIGGTRRRSYNLTDEFLQNHQYLLPYLMEIAIVVEVSFVKHIILLYSIVVHKITALYKNT